LALQLLLLQGLLVLLVPQSTINLCWKSVGVFNAWQPQLMWRTAGCSLKW
jgi:hypothetical protein